MNEITLAVISFCGIILGAVISSITTFGQAYIDRKAKRDELLLNSKKDAYVQLLATLDKAESDRSDPELEQRVEEVIHEALFLANNNLYERLVNALEATSNSDWPKHYGMPREDAIIDLRVAMQKDIGLVK